MGSNEVAERFDRYLTRRQGAGRGLHQQMLLFGRGDLARRIVPAAEVEARRMAVPADHVALHDVQCLEVRPKALRVRYEGRELWVPRSKLHAATTCRGTGQRGRLVVPAWLARVLVGSR